MKHLPTLGPGWLSAAVALFIVVALNGTLWSQLYRVVAPVGPADWLFLASFFVAQLATYLFFLRALSLPLLLKGVAALLVVTAAAVSHFMAEYGTVIDVNMVHNVLQTDPAEARDLTTVAAVLRIVMLGLLPAGLILVTPVRWPSPRGLLRSNATACLSALAIVAVNFAAFSGDYFSVLREHREVALTSTPANVVIAGGKLVARSWRHRSVGPVATVGADAVVEPSASGARPHVTILVLGETARAANFGLFGYERDTTPGLKQVSDLVAFPNVMSCGTDTATSVPCIFSGLGRSKYSLRAFQSRENLLDVVKRAGNGVVWIDNQGGCKGVCARVSTVSQTKRQDPRFCADGECHDEILLDGLPERLAAMPNGGVIVLHMMGSHGPAYYKRVPHEFARFQPTCETAQFSKCASADIINSYDNTIAYTDHVLTELILLLREVSGVDTTMLYVSDHGESLGENGIYLHAMPYMLAPLHQKHVPMMLWQSQGALRAQEIDSHCLASAAQSGHFTHDNVFHTVLGLQRIRTSIYDAGLDILQPCRQHHAT